jgi:uncharacterized membrane protein YozB (DUF420 family)
MSKIIYENTIYSKITAPIVTLSFAYLWAGIPMLYPRGDNSLELSVVGTIISAIYLLICTLLIRRSKGDVKHKDKLLAAAATGQVVLIVAMIVVSGCI